MKKNARLLTEQNESQARLNILQQQTNTKSTFQIICDGNYQHDCGRMWISVAESSIRELTMSNIPCSADNNPEKNIRKLSVRNIIAQAARMISGSFFKKVWSVLLVPLSGPKH
ncbi:hypothetical protein ABR759_00510 [Escherichia coli]